MSDFAIHPTAGIIGEADSALSRTRALLAPALPELCILDNGDPLATLAVKSEWQAAISSSNVCQAKSRFLRML